jgi:hypothetical protein
VIARVVVVLVAVVAVAWLCVMARDHDLVTRGLHRSTHLNDVKGNFERADADFRDARFLNPDLGVELDRSLLYQGAGHPQRSAELAAEVARREPDNLVAWIQLLALARGKDPAAVRRALGVLQRLDPLDAPRR